MQSILEYEPIVGKETIHELDLFAGRLSGVVVQHINSTSVGGGVAEILNRMIPLFKDVGVNASWDVIKGGEKFFEVTKKIHNSLHGQGVEISREEFDLFVATNEANARGMEFRGDVIFIHDPQPIGLVERKAETGRHWIWRCHIDFSRPDPATWDFLKHYIERYDASIFSAPAFARELTIPQILIAPSIDPLSDKNKELSQDMIDSVLTRNKINPERPIVTQISRFDYLKDPMGVIQVFRKVRKYIDCQLVLAGGSATDDPEGEKVLAEVREAATNDPDIFLLSLPPGSDIEINALQRASTVVLQKSLREGFGLTIAEALWK
ncbi:MAG TPA: glycosyltransferase, partial [Bacteroidota bacterium]|nr:glycosyltransferase [Bacteroidota bacterium]